MLTVVDIQTIVHLYRSGDYSRRGIARKLGISRTTVDKVLAQYEATQETSDNEALDNLLTASAETIAELYRNRWSVELFFKWIKQHLRIKKFWGTSENAVRIQIYCAIITYCLVAIVQHDMKLERSIYEVLQILGISLTDKTSLRDLFDKSNFKNVNVLCDSSEPNLFNF